MDNGQTNSNGVVANGIGEDSLDPATPWLQYIVDSVQRRQPVPTARMPVDRNAVYYNMNHRRRGLAILFNHEHFDGHQNLKARSGTNVDLDNLKECLAELGFEIWSFHDRTSAQVSEIINKAANVEDHADRDCLVVAVLTHGEHGILYTKDSAIKPESLWTPFSADKCPSLAGKPKLFFIQACQGDKLDAGALLTRTETDSGSQSYKIPVHADFLIAYSTIPGYYSWRNTTRGSWFMQALCQEIKENGYLLDLLTILTFVNQRVALDYESNTPDNPVMHQQKQIPCITYMLTRLVKFTRKPNA